MQRNTKGLPYTFYNCQVNSFGKLNDTRIKITYRLLHVYLLVRTMYVILLPK